jgi:opacity protein-like surface antigen
MRLRRLLPLVCLLLAAFSSPAFADGTLFLGTVTKPTNHATRGFAIGAGFLIVGVEFEYASTKEDAENAAPSLRTGMGNFYVQTPIPVAGMQFYWTTGMGGYRERLGTTHQETNLVFNTGGGAKVSLLGPLKVRLDYRVLRLRGEALFPTLHRLYAGLNLGF